MRNDHPRTRRATRPGAGEASDDGSPWGREWALPESARSSRITSIHLIDWFDSTGSRLRRARSGTNVAWTNSAAWGSRPWASASEYRCRRSGRARRLRVSRARGLDRTTVGIPSREASSPGLPPRPSPSVHLRTTEQPLRRRGSVNYRCRCRSDMHVSIPSLRDAGRWSK